MLLSTSLISFSIPSLLIQIKERKETQNEQDPLLPPNDFALDCQFENSEQENFSHSTSQCYVDDENQWSLRNYIDFMTQRNISSLLAARCLYTLSGTALPKLYSLWALTPHSDGGMGYSPRESANLTACVAIILFFADLAMPSLTLRWLGYKKSLCTSLITLSIVISMFWFPARMKSKNVAFVTILTTFVIARAFTAIAKIATWAKKTSYRKIFLGVSWLLNPACSLLVAYWEN